MFESGAILFHLAERSGALRPEPGEEAQRTLQWTLFQAAHLGPMMGQLWHFKVSAPERIPYAVGRYEREVERLFGVLDGELARHAHVAGERYGIADVMSWPWVDAFPQLGLTLEGHPHLRRWHAEVGVRPAVRRGMRVPEVAGGG